MFFVFCLFFLGEKLLPDYFLDDAEDFQQEWLQSQKKTSSSQSSSETATPPSSEAGGDTPAALFAQVKTLLNSEIVGQIKATYLFVLEGDHPGKSAQSKEGLIDSISPLWYKRWQGIVTLAPYWLHDIVCL